jgi:anti-sigma factor RsiW
MKYPDSHLSDQQLILDVEGELPARDEKTVRAHVEACWKCRVRRQELERAIADFVRLHQREFDRELPPAAGPRALLKARLAQFAEAGHRESERLWLGRSGWFRVLRATAAAVAICIVLALGSAVARLGRERKVQSAAVVYMPNARLTPGATILAGRPAVCSQPGTGNKAVPTALQREVFREYGIPGADPRAYEVDYLVTPALGGADDIRNLWPHSHSAVWSARVKDALEDRLREMVCAGDLDLTEAQREIAADWVSAYKKYFHTDEPLPEHRR